jgi:hypothetical protein
MDKPAPERVTVEAACKIIGGDKPIHRTTFYRGVKAGIYPAPDRVGLNTSRVNTKKLLAAIAARETDAA